MTVSPKDNSSESTTMRDVARTANVSQSAVSRILSPTTTGSKVEISEETRKKS